MGIYPFGWTFNSPVKIDKKLLLDSESTIWQDTLHNEENDIQPLSKCKEDIKLCCG
jgi:hypothetical protein